jgi:hypothetical protein
MFTMFNAPLPETIFVMVRNLDHAQIGWQIIFFSRWMADKD